MNPRQKYSQEFKNAYENNDKEVFEDFLSVNMIKLEYYPDISTCIKYLAHHKKEEDLKYLFKMINKKGMFAHKHHADALCVALYESIAINNVDFIKFIYNGGLDENKPTINPKNKLSHMLNFFKLSSDYDIIVTNPHNKYFNKDYLSFECLKKAINVGNTEVIDLVYNSLNNIKPFNNYEKAQLHIAAVESSNSETLVYIDNKIDVNNSKIQKCINQIKQSINENNLKPISARNLPTINRLDGLPNPINVLKL